MTQTTKTVQTTYGLAAVEVTVCDQCGLERLRYGTLFLHVERPLPMFGQLREMDFCTEQCLVTYFTAQIERVK
jgi:hypothetical protein